MDSVGVVENTMLNRSSHSYRKRNGRDACSDASSDIDCLLESLTSAIQGIHAPNRNGTAPSPRIPTFGQIVSCTKKSSQQPNKTKPGTSWRAETPRRNARRKVGHVSPGKRTPTRVKVPRSPAIVRSPGHAPSRPKDPRVTVSTPTKQLIHRQNVGKYGSPRSVNLPSSPNRRQSLRHRRRRVVKAPTEKCSENIPHLEKNDADEDEVCITPSGSKHRHHREKEMHAQESGRITFTPSDEEGDSICPSPAKSRISSPSKKGSKRSPQGQSSLAEFEVREKCEKRTQKEPHPVKGGGNSLDISNELKTNHRHSQTSVCFNVKNLQLKALPLLVSPDFTKDADEISVYSTSSDGTENSSLDSGTSAGSFAVRDSADESSCCFSFGSSVCPSVTCVFDIGPQTLEEIVTPRRPTRRRSRHERAHPNGTKPLAGGDDWMKSNSKPPPQGRVSDQGGDDDDLSVYTASSDTSQDSSLDSGTSAGSFTAGYSTTDEVSLASSVRSSVACFFDTGAKPLEEILAPSQPKRTRTKHMRKIPYAAASDEETSVSSNRVSRHPFGRQKERAKSSSVGNIETPSARPHDAVPSRPRRHRTRRKRPVRKNYAADSEGGSLIRSSADAPRRPERQRTQHYRRTAKKSREANVDADESSICPSVSSTRQHGRRNGRNRASRSRTKEQTDKSARRSTSDRRRQERQLTLSQRQTV